MLTLLFIRRLFKKFPSLLIINVLLFLLISLVEAVGVVSLVMVADLFLNPSLNNISLITQHAIVFLKAFGIPSTFTWFLAIFLFFSVLKTILQIFSQYLILKTKYVVLRDISVGTFEDFFAAKWYFFSSEKQGTLLNTFNREVSMVGDAFGAMARYFSSVLQIALFLIVPFYISWQVTLLTMIIALFFSIPFVLLGKISYRLGVLNIATGNEIGKIISEGLNSAKVILGFGNQSKIVKSFKAVYDKHCSITVKSQTLSLSLPLTHYPVGLLILVVGLFLSRKFALPISETVVLFYSLSRVMPLIGTIAEQKSRLDNYYPSFEQIIDLRKRAKELTQPTGRIRFECLNNKISIEDLTFAYPKHESVLNNINMVIPKGKMVAIIGESGSGKSTLIDMIMYFHHAVSGNITVDGRKIEDLDVISYRKRLGYVPQDIILFNMSIRDNLLWSNEFANEEEIWNACVQANAEEFIKELPNGLDTLVGDRGVRLSGGQAQRVALARAIIRKPELLILDEATSSLDTSSERLIQQAIEKIAKETTIIVVAHRLSTILSADHIYVLNDGRIIEEGPYSELIRKDGTFKRMVQLQNLANL